MSDILEPFTSDEFLQGLAYGGAALAAGLILALAWRRWRRTPAHLVGALLVGAAYMAMPTARETPDALWQGIAMLATAGFLFPWARKAPLLPAILAIPGAWWITRVIDLPVDGWPNWVLFAMIVIGAPLVASFDLEHTRRGFGPVFLALTVAGAYATLPDTEEILVLFGVAIPLVFIAWPRPLASLGAWGAYPAVGLLAWVIAWGGRGRETAIIGAAAGLGLLVAEPAARWISSRSVTLLDRLPAGTGGPVLAGLAQFVVVAVTARVAGLQSSAIVAGVIGALTLAGAVVVLAAMNHGRERRRARQRG